MAQRRLAFGTPDSTVRKTTPRLIAWMTTVVATRAHAQKIRNSIVRPVSRAFERPAR
jgi:hypothetical protein